MASLVRKVLLGVNQCREIHLCLGECSDIQFLVWMTLIFETTLLNFLHGLPVEPSSVRPNQAYINAFCRVILGLLWDWN